MLPEQGGVAGNLVRAFLAKDQTGYAALFADEVQVFDDKQLIAHNKVDQLQKLGQSCRQLACYSGLHQATPQLAASCYRVF